jgi:hypothetical protein
VSLPRMPVCPQTALVGRIVGHALRIYDRGLRRTLVNSAATLKIDANFEALGVETARPFKRARALKIVPLNAHPHLRKTAEKRTPLPFDLRPNRLLAEFTPLPHPLPILRLDLNNN